MKVLALMGAMRRHHNTEDALDIFLETHCRGDEVEKVILKDLNIVDCLSCNGCQKAPRCVVQDDMTALYPKFEAADLVIFAAPIYFNSIAGVAKLFVDRLQVYWSRKFILKLEPIAPRIGVAIICGGAEKEVNQFVGTEAVLNHYFKVSSFKTNYTFEVANTDDEAVRDSDKYKEMIQTRCKPGTYRVTGDGIYDYKPIY
ncbi:flavodoxin family protein [Peptoniphilus equinus]|uniref:Flavodoxin family protein n=1 Tax=Peptoniphilus equinus TaxID=3016343 RepID=A0ABY7QU85_9FIRM|nr:flavodoxin family protein [Peptoniphilus equinus]WBW50347.1 flavodoxin family protein [Peptoniphilus equinus]